MIRLSIPSTLAFLLLAGCGGEGAQPAEPPDDQAAYAAPPVVTSVAVDAGGLIVSGQAGPDERVRLIEMDGVAHGVTAGPDGSFAAPVPGRGPADRLLNLTVQRAGQAVSSDGWLFSPAAAPERAVMLRPGGASLPIGEAPLLAVADVDSGGGLALAGRARPGQAVEVRIDGEPRGATEAAADGRWVLVLSSAVAPGVHAIAVTAGDRQARRSLALEPSQASGPIRVEPIEGAVKIAWALPGGGAQTTWILLP